jgi:hypothetical protein
MIQPETETLHPTDGIPMPAPETDDEREVTEALADFAAAREENLDSRR